MQESDARGVKKMEASVWARPLPPPLPDRPPPPPPPSLPPSPSPQLYHPHPVEQPALTHGAPTPGAVASRAVAAAAAASVAAASLRDHVLPRSAVEQTTETVMISVDALLLMLLLSSAVAVYVCALGVWLCRWRRAERGKQRDAAERPEALETPPRTPVHLGGKVGKGSPISRYPGHLSDADPDSDKVMRAARLTGPSRLRLAWGSDEVV